MTVDANRALVRRYFESFVLNDQDALDDIVAADVVDHTPYEGQPAGRDGYHDMYNIWHHAFPGLQAEIEDMIAEGDRVATRWTFRGRHVGEYDGIAPTGRDISFQAISIVRIENGVVAEEWFMGDMLGLRRQLQPEPNAG